MGDCLSFNLTDTLLLNKKKSNFGLILGVRTVTLTNDKTKKKKEVNVIDPNSNRSYKTTVNIICEGLLLIFFLIMMKKWLLLKYIPISSLEYKNHSQFMSKVAKIS